MRTVRCISTARNAYSEYVTFIAFPLQQWLDEDILMLRCTYIGYIVNPYPANADKMVGSCQCKQMADGI
jgi:hypothetical protein